MLPSVCSRAVGQTYDALKKHGTDARVQAGGPHRRHFSANYQVKQQTIRSKNVLAPICRAARIRTKQSSTAHIGITSASVHPMRAATPSTTARSITGLASRRCSSSRALLRPAREAKRSLVFAFWTAEEKGLLGSEYYAAIPYTPSRQPSQDSTSMRCAAGRAHDVVVVGSGQTDSKIASRRYSPPKSRDAPDATPEAGTSSAPTTFPMAKRGVPMLYMDSGIDLLTWRRRRPCR